MSTVTDSEFAVVLLTQDGTIVDAHPTCYESLGWNREELAGKDIGDLLQSDRELLMAQLLQSRDAETGMDGQTSFSLRILARRRDETSFPARVVVRRFDQTGCCTAAFYRVNPYNDYDTAPTVRPEEIELAMRGNSVANSQQPKADKPKSRWRNARLLFGSKPQPSQPAPAPAPAASAPKPAALPHSDTQPIAAQPSRPMLKLHPQIPENIFQRKDSPAPIAPVQPQPDPAPVQEQPAAAVSEEIQPVQLSPAREPIVPVEEVSEQDHGEKLSYESLARELDQEREERRRLEQRAASLTTQVSALHLQVSENLEIESHNQKKAGTLEDQVREARAQVAQLKSDLATERQKAAAAEEKVDAANAVSTSLTEQLEALKVVHEALTGTQAECENQLKTANSELRQAQDALAAETARRQEVELALANSKQQRTELDRTSKLEMSKLETILKEKELELKEARTKNAQAVLQAKS